MDKTAEQIAAGFGQDVDLADGQPMFITIAGREIVVMDAVAFSAMQNKAECWETMAEETVKRARLPRSIGVSASVIHKV